MTSIEHIKGIYYLSTGFWLLFSIYSFLTVKKFIVKRYEKETGLINTIYFTKHYTFIQALPDILASCIYATHLLTFTWGWKFVEFIKNRRKNVIYYDDIENPEKVTCHFSRKEIRSVKISAICMLIVILHIVGMEIIEFIWPKFK